MRLFDFSYSFPNTIEDIDKFSGKEFEVFLFEYFKITGGNPRLTNDTDDKGVDLMIDILNQKGEKLKVGIQAKRWKGTIGAIEVRKMLDGKDHYNLDQLWIVSTSKLTSSATTTAKNHNIEVLNRDVVIELINDLKGMEDVKFMPIKKPKVIESKRDIIEKNNYKVSSELEKDLKELRRRIARENKISKLYLVYNNKTLLDICDKLPLTKEELLKIKGIGPVKYELFGVHMIEVINKHKNSKKDQLSEEVINNRTKFYISIRNRIRKYNSFKNVGDCFDNSTLDELVKEMPTTLEELKNVKGFPEKNIDIFGEYLVNRILQYID